MFEIYIKDLLDGSVRKYGKNHHDSLMISKDGRYLSYCNIKNGDGSLYGDYKFCDKDGVLPCEDEVLIKHGAEAYANIGGFNNYIEEFENLFIHEHDYKQFFKDVYGAKEPDYNLYDLVAKYGAKKVLDDFIRWGKNKKWQSI